MPRQSCTVSFTGPNGVRHSVNVTAESLYGAAALGVSLLRQDGTTHAVTIAQVRRWTEGIAASPDDVLRKNRLKRLLDGQA